jgi:hypothetical protein
VSGCVEFGSCATGFRIFRSSMMRSLFRAFEASDVRYLLISGQACVLYGLSNFTEDIDLWIQPGTECVPTCIAV